MKGHSIPNVMRRKANREIYKRAKREKGTYYATLLGKIQSGGMNVRRKNEEKGNESVS